MIVSCGEALIDLVAEPVPGGGPMNVAVAARRLGAPAAFVGRISTDEYGEAIVAHLEKNNVDLRACQRGPEPTTRAIVEHKPHVEYRFQGVGTADTNLTEVELSKLDRGPHIIHGGALGMFRGRTADTLAALVERHDGIVSLDPNVRPGSIEDRDSWTSFHERWIANTHVYKASDEDFEWIWPNRSVSSCAAELLAGSVEVVLETRGGDGVTVYLPSEQFTIASHDVEVVDTVGAGDTFVAAVLVSLWERGLAGSPDRVSAIGAHQWKQITQRAVTAAAVTCTRSGADPPTLAELGG